MINEWALLDSGHTRYINTQMIIQDTKGLYLVLGEGMEGETESNLLGLDSHQFSFLSFEDSDGWRGVLGEKCLILPQL